MIFPAIIIKVRLLLSSVYMPYTIYTNESWTDFDLKVYTEKYQSAATDIADWLQKDDLMRFLR